MSFFFGMFYQLVVFLKWTFQNGIFGKLSFLLGTIVDFRFDLAVMITIIFIEIRVLSQNFNQ